MVWENPHIYILSFQLWTLFKMKILSCPCADDGDRDSGSILFLICNIVRVPKLNLSGVRGWVCVYKAI